MTFQFASQSRFISINKICLDNLAETSLFHILTERLKSGEMFTNIDLDKHLQAFFLFTLSQTNPGFHVSAV